jgi:hypothetical protein
MTARRLTLECTVLLAAGLACGGCEHTDPLRQGIAQSSYRQELRQLGEETKRKELAKFKQESDDIPDEEVHVADTVRQADHWEALPLLNAVHVQPPQPFDAGEPNPPPGPP